jgi:hypothetical protein
MDNKIQIVIADNNRDNESQAFRNLKILHKMEKPIVSTPSK